MSEEHPQFDPDADFFANPESFSEAEPIEPFPPIEEESHVPPPLPAAPLPRASTPPPVAAPPARPAARPVVTSEYRPKAAPAAFAMLLLGGAVLGGGVGLGKMLPAPPPAAPAAAPSTTTTTSPAASTDVAATTIARPAASTEDHKALAAKVDDLSKALEANSKTIAALQGKLDAMPKSAPTAVDLKPIEEKLAGLDTKVADLAAKPAPAAGPGAMADLKPIETKVGDLAKTVGGMSEVPAMLAALKTRVDSQEKAIAAMKTTTAASTPAAASTSTTEKPAASSSPDIEADLAKAVGLFKQNQFGPARDAFVKLSATAPNDARVWYYAAISNGAATNVWDSGDTIKFVNQGIARERAGTPDKAKLDATFAEVIPQLKPWLDGYRASAR